MRALSESELYWWKDRWWADEEYLRLYGDQVSLAEVDSKIDRVARVFDASWGKQVGLHPVHYHLLSKGTMPLGALFTLGRDLECVEGCTGLRAVIEGLRNPKEYESARFELAMGAILCGNGHEVAFRPQLPHGKSADFSSRKKEQIVFFELKKIRESQAQLASSEFSSRLLYALTDLTRDPGGPFPNYHFQVALEPELLSAFGAGPNVDIHIIDGAVAQIAAEIRTRLTNGEMSFELPGAGTFAFDSTKGTKDSAVSSQHTGPGRELRRILQKALSEGINQLHPDFPGIIVVQSSSELHESMTRVVISGLLAGLQNKGQHVSAIIFLPVLYGIGLAWAYFNAFAVSNPNARVNPIELEAFKDVSDVLLKHKVATPGG